MFSWTLTKKVASHFAGLASANGEEQYQTEPISDASINNAIDTYNRTGFVSFLGTKFIKNKDMPQYYDMWNRNGFMTDGDDLEKYLKDQQEYINDYNKRIANNGRIIKQDIPINDIIWITNKLKSLEFIVRGHSE